MGVGELAHSGAPCVQDDYGVQGGSVEPCGAQGSLFLSPLPPEPRLSFSGSTSRQDLAPSWAHWLQTDWDKSILWGSLGPGHGTLTGLCKAFWTRLPTLLHPDLVFQSLHFKGHFSFAGCF